LGAWCWCAFSYWATQQEYHTLCIAGPGVTSTAEKCECLQWFKKIILINYWMCHVWIIREPCDMLHWWVQDTEITISSLLTTTLPIQLTSEETLNYFSVDTASNPHNDSSVKVLCYSCIWPCPKRILLHLVKLEGSVAKWLGHWTWGCRFKSCSDH